MTTSAEKKRKEKKTFFFISLVCPATPTYGPFIRCVPSSAAILNFKRERRFNPAEKEHHYVGEQGRRDETDKKQSKRLARVEVGFIFFFYDLRSVKAAAFSSVNKPNGYDPLALCANKRS